MSNLLTPRNLELLLTVVVVVVVFVVADWSTCWSPCWSLQLSETAAESLRRLFTHLVAVVVILPSIKHTWRFAGHNSDFTVISMSSFLFPLLQTAWDNLLTGSSWCLKTDSSSSYIHIYIYIHTHLILFLFFCYYDGHNTFQTKFCVSSS